MSSANLTPLQIWFLAARPKTLPAATAPVILGTAIAYHEGNFDLLPALAALAVALLLQIGANFANDLFDFKKGADTHERRGPLRVTQAGLVSPKQMVIAMWITFGLAALCGLYLAYSAGWGLVWVGLAAILAALAYTGGPFPLGYNGLGEIFVFIFFGLVAVGGTVYVQSHAISTLAWLAAISIGLLASAILVVNNLRDLETDRKAGKHTLAVRFGANGARLQYTALLGFAFLVPWVGLAAGLVSPLVLLTNLALIKAWSLVRVIWAYDPASGDGKAMNQALAGTGQLELIFALLFSLALVVGG